MKFAPQEQLRRENRDPENYTAGEVLIEGQAIADAPNRLSRQRVEDTRVR